MSTERNAAHQSSTPGGFAELEVQAMAVLCSHRDPHLFAMDKSRDQRVPDLLALLKNFNCTARDVDEQAGIMALPARRHRSAVSTTRSECINSVNVIGAWLCQNVRLLPCTNCLCIILSAA